MPQARSPTPSTAETTLTPEATLRVRTMSAASSVRVNAIAYDAVAPLRDAYRAGAGCQIVHDSILRRGLADASGGGVLMHYNPPYGDIYLEVRTDLRRRGIGSWLVQKLRGVCHEEGLVPAARCNPDNIASWRALERGGTEECGRPLAARVGARA